MKTIKTIKNLISFSTFLVIFTGSRTKSHATAELRKEKKKVERKKNEKKK
jgi:hypothetical protein